MNGGAGVFLHGGKWIFDQRLFLLAAEGFDFGFSSCSKGSRILLFMINEMNRSAPSGIFCPFVRMIMFMESLLQVCCDASVTGSDRCNGGDKQTREEIFGT
jgi:hypothetical protein